MKISIITASFNYAQYIEAAINSVLNQSYLDWELIIVDDGSSDNSLEIIKSYCKKDERFKFVTHENNQNKGLKETLLLGLKNATGDWIAFLESDDVFEPDNLAEKVKIIEKYPEVKLIFNKVKFLSKKPQKRQKIFEKTQEKLSKMRFPRKMFYDFGVENMILTFSCVMVEAHAIKNVDFETPEDNFLDWWLWINLAHKNIFYYIDEELTNWRLHDESYIKKTKMLSFLLPIKAYWKIFKQKNDIRLLFFIVYSSSRLILNRIFRKIKSIL